MRRPARCATITSATCATESPTTPMHNATVEIFDPGESGFDHDRLVQLIADGLWAGDQLNLVTTTQTQKQALLKAAERLIPADD